MERIGRNYRPEDETGEQQDYIYVEKTGMEYEIYADGLVAAYHDAVGLVTWYRMSEAEIDAIRGEAEEGEEYFEHVCVNCGQTFDKLSKHFMCADCEPVYYRSEEGD